MKIFDYLFPIKCIHCNNYGSTICKDCINLYYPTLPECFLCRRVSNHNLSHSGCFCKDNHFKSVKVCYRYTNITKLSMREFKYKNNILIANTLIKNIKQPITNYLNSIGEHLYLVPAPLNFFRRVERGFNQSEIIANEIRLTQKEKSTVVINDLLLRPLNKLHQAYLNRNLRELNMQENEFILNSLKAKKINTDSPLIIIDDVITTGSTVNQIAQTLYKNDFKNLHCLSLFRGNANFKKKS